VSGFVYLITFTEIVGSKSLSPAPTAAWARLHPEIAWAKLRAPRDGAAIASKKFWS